MSQGNLCYSYIKLKEKLPTGSQAKPDSIRVVCQGWENHEGKHSGLVFIQGGDIKFMPIEWNNIKEIA